MGQGAPRISAAGAMASITYGAEVIEVSLFGLASDRVSRGHRFHGQSSVTIAHADAYEATLKEQFVIASVDERKALIKGQVEGLASKDERSLSMTTCSEK